MPPLTIYLSRLIGLFLLVAALAMLVDKPGTLDAVHAIAEQRSMQIVLGMVGVAIGLAVVLGHQIWSGGILPVVITLLGWIMLIRGVVLLLMSRTQITKVIDWLGVDEYFYLYLGVAAAIGLYLTIHGFVAKPAASRNVG
jgi:vacuolar-type H+-ATPase subunit I/STV1